MSDENQTQAKEDDSNLSQEDREQDAAFDAVMQGAMAPTDFGEIEDSEAEGAKAQQAQTQVQAEVQPQEGEGTEEGTQAEGEGEGQESGFEPPSWVPKSYADWENEDPAYWRERLAKEAGFQIKTSGRIGEMTNQMRQMMEQNAELQKQLQEERAKAQGQAVDLSQIPSLKELRESDEETAKVIDDVVAGFQSELKRLTPQQTTAPQAPVAQSDPYMDRVRREQFDKDLNSMMDGATEIRNSDEFQKWMGDSLKTDPVVHQLAQSWNAVDGITLLHRFMVANGGNGKAAPAAQKQPADANVRSGAGIGSRGVRGEKGKTAAGAKKPGAVDYDKMSEEEAFQHMMRQPVPDTPF